MSATLALPKKEALPVLLKVSEVAKILSVSRQTVHHLMDSGDLKASRVNPEQTEREHQRITRESLLKFYKKRFGHCLIDALTHSFRP